MKKTTKALLGVGGFLAMAGLLLAVAGWAMGGQTNMTVNWFGYPVNVGVSGFGYGLRGSDMEYASGGTWMQDRDLSLAAFQELDVDLALGDVTVQTGDTYGVELEWRGERYSLHYTNENGTLRVWSETQQGIGFHSGGSIDAAVTVYLPGGAQLKRVDVDADLGDCSLSGFSARELIVDASLGGVDLSDVHADDADLTLDLGDLTVSRVTADTMALNLSLGSLSAWDLTTGQSLTVDNSMGDIELSGTFRGVTELTDSMGGISVSTTLRERDYGYDFRVSMGKIYIDGEEFRDRAERGGGEHRLTIKNDMGDVEVNFGA